MKKLLSLIICGSIVASVSLGFAACGDTAGGEPSQPQALEGNYVLESAKLGGKDRTNDFQTYTAAFQQNGTLRVTVSYLGALDVRNSAYTFDGETVTEVYGAETYYYTAHGDTLKTTYVDFEDCFDILLKKEKKDDSPQAVEFEGILFGTDMNDSKFFNYCPAILRETVNGEDVMHVWYCTNKDDGVIMDHIGYRKGVRQADGKWLFGEQQIAMQPTPDTWDSRHTCDPAVVRGEFKYGGKTYPYLMAYLGCVTEDYSKNETGIAVAEAPEGPWIKLDKLNPIVPWQDGGMNQNTNNWGTGMPALINVDGKGDVLLFYQSGNRGTGIQRWDFSDLDAPELAPSFTATLNHKGIVNSQGIACRVNIPDFAYDPVAKRFYVCGVTNEKNPPDITKTLVNSHSLVAYIENVESVEALCELLRTGNYEWEMLGYVGPSDTGFARNHNPGIVRDEFGRLPSSEEIWVIVATGKNDQNLDNIFTYRLHGKILKCL